MKENIRLQNFPISSFSIILGLAGFTIAFQRIENFFNFPKISIYILLSVSSLFLFLTFLYLSKIIKFKKSVMAEFNNSVKISFFPTFSISLLLLSIAFLPVYKTLSVYLVIIGVILHLIFTIKIISVWMYHAKFEMIHMSPAWFIPAVGNILVPVAGAGLLSAEILWFFFSIGFIFWAVMLVIFFNRIIFHQPLPDKLLPTLFILIAPPAIGFIALVKLIGFTNEFSKGLYHFAVFLMMLLFSQLNIFYKIKFYLSWWAYSFPIAAVTIATVLMFHETDVIIFKYFAYTLFVLLIVVLGILITKTVKAVISREICIEEK